MQRSCSKRVFSHIEKILVPQRREIKIDLLNAMLIVRFNHIFRDIPPLSLSKISEKLSNDLRKEYIDELAILK